METADIRDREALDALLAGGPRRVLLLAAQASRPISEREPDYTEETNLTGRAARRRGGRRRGRRRARATAARCTSTGARSRARSAPARPTASRATSRTSRRSTPSSRSACTRAAAASGSRTAGSGSSTGRARSSTTRPDSQTVVDKFRRLAAAGEPLTLDGGGRATIGVVHVADAARLLLDCPVPAPAGRRYNLAAETLTVADVAALAEGARAAGGAAWTLAPQLRVRAQRRRVPARSRVRFLVTGVTGFLGWRAATLLRRARPRRRSALARPGGAARAHAAELDAVEHVDAGDPAARDAGRAAATSCCTSPACPTRPARARTRRAPCARTPARRSTCSTAASSTAPALDLPVDRARRRSSRRPTPTRSPSGSARRPAATTRRAPTVVRLTSVFGPGQVAWEGATGAIAAFAARALEGEPIVIPGDPQRVRDFVYVDDVVAGARGDRRRGPLERDAHARQRRPDAAAARRRARARRRRLRRRRSRRRAASCRRARTRATRRSGDRAARLDRPSASRSAVRSMSTGSAAIPLLKAAPEADQVADRLDGGRWRGLELCLAPRHVADDGGARRARSRSVAAGADAGAVAAPPRRRSRWPSGAFVRVDRLDDEARAGIERSAAFAAGDRLAGADDPPVRPA